MICRPQNERFAANGTWRSKELIQLENSDQMRKKPTKITKLPQKHDRNELWLLWHPNAWTTFSIYDSRLPELIRQKDALMLASCIQKTSQTRNETRDCCARETPTVIFPTLRQLKITKKSFAILWRHARNTKPLSLRRQYWKQDAL